MESHQKHPLKKEDVFQWFKLAGGLSSFDSLFARAVWQTHSPVTRFLSPAHFFLAFRGAIKQKKGGCCEVQHKLSKYITSKQCRTSRSLLIPHLWLEPTVIRTVIENWEIELFVQAKRVIQKTVVPQIWNTSHCAYCTCVCDAAVFSLFFISNTFPSSMPAESDRMDWVPAQLNDQASSISHTQVHSSKLVFAIHTHTSRLSLVV